MYRLITVLFTSTLAITISYGQQLSPQLSPTTLSPAVESQLREIRQLRADTAYRGPVLPIGPISGDETNNRHFPYPVIFIHGLGSSADTWADFTALAVENGWNYGGQLRYHLNMDGNNSVTNIYLENSPELKRFHTLSAAADFYTINFNVDRQGLPLGEEPNPLLSNQAAIVKQGYAVSDAVQDVMEACGVDKVILFGHSMGGLAARQYLQNPELWPDENHHIAKYISSGTPHGGSNFSGGAFVDFFRDGTDEQSDAVRDLRTSYYVSGNSGVFLSGGIESLDYMEDSRFNNFYNADVNCNGRVGEYVIGLNEKDLPVDLEYAAIIGVTEAALTIDDSDGVVEVWSAQLLANRYIDAPNETFWYEPAEAGFEIHTNLPKQTDLNIFALDEPDNYEVAYQVSPNTTYTGYFTPQAEDGDYEPDFDSYRFELEEEVELEISLSAETGMETFVTLLDGETEEVIDSLIFEDSGRTLTRRYSPGSYLIDIASFADSDGFVLEYTFTIQTTTVETVSANDPLAADKQPSLYPNPATHFVRMPITQPTEVQVYDTQGKVVLQTTVNDDQLEVQYLPKGLYTLRTKEGGNTYHFIKQ
jgi:pimeloyl-ACP methyl ester carboxylesterase